LSAILVYLTLKQQIAANKLIHKQFRAQQRINIEQEQFSLLLNKIRDWKLEVEYLNIKLKRNSSSKGEEVLEFEGRDAISRIFRRFDDLKIGSTDIANIETFRLLNFSKVSDYLETIIVYFYAIIPGIKNREKLYLLFLELQAINISIVRIPDNLHHLVSFDHLGSPVELWEKYEIVKVYIARNYQMTRIEMEMFNHFRPTFDISLDPARALRYQKAESYGEILLKDKRFSEEISSVIS
jgi:hypothetical protein